MWFLNSSREISFMGWLSVRDMWMLPDSEEFGAKLPLLGWLASYSSERSRTFFFKASRFLDGDDMAVIFIVSIFYMTVFVWTRCFLKDLRKHLMC